MRKIRSISTLRKLVLVCTVLTLLFIWGNSLLPGDVSSQESGWVQELLEPVLRFIGSGRIQLWLDRLADRLPGELSGPAHRVVDWLDRNVLSRDPAFLVRKAAHLSEFMLLGFFMALLFAHSDGRGRVFLPENGCLAAALVDEGIQLFSIQRTSQLRDVCIDLAGSTMGLAAALVLLTLLRFIAWLHRPKSGKFS